MHINYIKEEDGTHSVFVVINNFLNKEINNYNINDFFGLIIMTIKNYKSKIYIFAF